MNLRVIVISQVLGVMCLVALMCGGCSTPPSGPAQETPRRVSGAEEGQPVTSAELDELTRAFADRYVGLLYSVCDDLKKTSDPAQRREAQVLLVNCSTNVYDIASNADSFTRVLDLAVVSALLSQVWVDDGRAAAVFGERGETLARAMLRAQEETRALAIRVLTEEQLDLLDSLIRDWRQQNPDMIRVSFVRFANFAIGRGRSAASEVLAARGFFAEVGHTGQAVDEARLLGERMFYRLKREPTLVRWQAEAMKDDLLATPDIAGALANLNRLTDQIEQLPANVAAERQALVAGIEDSLQRADATVTNVKAALDNAHALVVSLQPASESLSRMFDSGDELFTRFDNWDRWKTDARLRPFDIRDYTETTRQLATTAERMNEMLTTSSNLLDSPDWASRIQQVNESADGRIALMADQSQVVLNAFFWRICALLGVLFAMLILYRLISVVLLRRLQGYGRSAHNHHAADPRPRGGHGFARPEADRNPARGDRCAHSLSNSQSDHSFQRPVAFQTQVSGQQ